MSGLVDRTAECLSGLVNLHRLGIDAITDVGIVFFCAFGAFLLIYWIALAQHMKNIIIYISKHSEYLFDNRLELVILTMTFSDPS